MLTRERLLDLAQARDSEAFDRAIDVRITRIRRKIEPDPAHPKVIKTVRGAGYVFSPDAQRLRQLVKANCFFAGARDETFENSRNTFRPSAKTPRKRSRLYLSLKGELNRQLRRDVR